MVMKLEIEVNSTQDIVNLAQARKFDVEARWYVISLVLGSTALGAGITAIAGYIGYTLGAK